MRNLFLANINIDSKGGIVAAPDYDTPGGSYYFHWMRDGALTIRTLQETSSNFTEVENIIKSYVTWVLNTDSMSDPNGQDVRTEPKFMLPNGEVFTGSWCRPQNDGPGLQATSLILFANELIARGEMDYVTKYLWTGDNNVYHGGAIKYNLDYVVTGYASDTCDLWEEIRNSNLFWNRYTMKQSMALGAEFAKKMGDSSSASSYSSTRDKLMANLFNDHWSGSYVLEATSRPQVHTHTNIHTYLGRKKSLVPVCLCVCESISADAMSCLFCLSDRIARSSWGSTTPSTPLTASTRPARRRWLAP